MSAKADCEELMNAGLPFAEEMLGKHGEFFPFGGAMRPNSDIVSVAGYDGRGEPASLEIIRLIKEAFVKGAVEEKYKATALFYDLRVALSGDGVMSDVIAVSLKHWDAYSVIVMFPYTLRENMSCLAKRLLRSAKPTSFCLPRRCSRGKSQLEKPPVGPVTGAVQTSTKTDP